MFNGTEVESDSMRIGLRMGPMSGVRWQLAQQLGVTHAVVNFPETDDGTDPWAYDPLRRLQERLHHHGFRFAATESRPPMKKTVLGVDGRDEEIADVKRCIRNLGKLGVDVYCWVWTENPLGVLRTDSDVRGRGGSTQSQYDHAVTEAQEKHPAADITEEELWGNLEHFLDEVVPVAENAGVKLALHPDDPPISPVRGVPRIITGVDAYDRVLEYYDSEYNGVAFCQGNFAAMGCDIPKTIHHFGDRLHFAHFRDVSGTPERFSETWHDNGPTDMAAALDAYLDIGFEGVIRPDHVGGMAGGQLGDGGNKGRLFAVGYLKGLVEQAEHHREQSVPQPIGE